ncbi:MAG: hypothetical protein EKK33_36985 [Bradyrhizobiaceae bacterium]|nr:MAG: hypothetical protein EKK33_36985 [Bradyrhizobiaceae bacterium]
MVKLPTCCREIVVRRGVMLFVFLVSALATQCALADDWPNLPDGRIVLDIKGVQLALPKKGSDLRTIRFSSDDGRDVARPGGQRWELTLERVLESPDEARDLFSRSGTIHVSIWNVTGRNDLWLNKFDRWQLRTLQIGISIGAPAAVANCKAWDSDFRQLSASLTANDSRIADDGWAEFVRGRSPVSRTFVQVESPAFISDLTCNALGSCYVPKCLSPDVGLSYEFSERVHNRTSWTTFNAKVTDVLRFVLLDLIK